MAWRLLLSERPIRRLDFLTGKPALVAAWTTVSEAGVQPRARVAFLDLNSGVKIDERTLDVPPFDSQDVPTWKSLLVTLTAPNKDTLPYVRIGQGVLFSAPDGALRLLAAGAEDLVFFRHDTPTRIRLAGGPRFRSAERGDRRA